LQKAHAMGRRNQHNPAEFDELVLLKVEAFLVHNPASALSLRKIASLIDYAPSTLISVYGNYANLLLRVNARTLSQLNQQLSACLGSRLKADTTVVVSEKLAQLALTYFTFAQKHSHSWQLIFDLRMPGNDPLPQWMQAAIDHSFELLVMCLKQLNPNKSDEEQHLASRVLWSGVHGITQLSLGDKLFLNQHSDGKTMIRSLLENYLATWAKTHH
jgi:AcrR family transcriptional regulator